MKRLFKSTRGSVLMEFVMVLPVYMAALGGIVWVGEKSLDTINLRSANHWSVMMAGNRFSVRTPAMLSLTKLFPRATAVYDSTQRNLVDEHSYLQFIGSKVGILQSTPEYLENLINAPYTTRGENAPSPLIPEFSVTSSRYGNDYTLAVVMRTKGSSAAKRHWHSSLIADKDIWKFEGKEDEYPKKWELSLLKNPKHTDDTKTPEKQPKKIEFYKRYKKYEEWSKSNK